MKNNKKMSKKHIKVSSDIFYELATLTRDVKTEKIYWCHFVRWTHSLILKQFTTQYTKNIQQKWKQENIRMQFNGIMLHKSFSKKKNN